MFYLRKLEQKDLPAVNKWRNDPELIRLLGMPFCYTTLGADIKWYESHMGSRGNAVHCAVTEDEEDDILGLISLVSINYMEQSAELHIMIGDSKNQNRGIGTFAVQEMLNHAFNNMNLQRIELTVLEDNRRARHLYEKIGFIQEGIKRNAKYKNGEFVNMVLYSILKKEYKANMPEKTTEGNLPTYSLSILSDISEKQYVLKACDNAFENPVTKRKEYNSLFRKWDMAANFIAAYNTDVLGYAIIYTNDWIGKVAYITLIAVRPEYQNMHIGQKLLMSSEIIARNHGMTSIKLEVAVNNNKAIRFYEKNGYVKIAEQGEKSIYMTKSLLNEYS